MNIKKGDLEWLKRHGHEKALAKLAFAWLAGRGVRLEHHEVCEIVASDDALHQRLYNEMERSTACDTQAQLNKARSMG